MLKLARKYHKWLMGLVGLQFLLWAVSGLYMVSMDIHYIHGETLVKPNINKLNLDNVNVTVSELAAQYPHAENISLYKLLDRSVYQFTVPAREKTTYLIDARTGQRVPKINQTLAKQIAQAHYYATNHAVKAVTLITNNPPSELSARHLPVWQVEFEHFSAPVFYISQETGKLVTKRHQYWRIFDWMWRLHIMDYDDGENVANAFLFLVTLLGVLSAIAGLILSYLRIFKSSEQESVRVG